MSAQQDDAKALVDTFAAGSAGSVWNNLDKNAIVTGLKDRIDKPDDISQGDSGLCGPSAFVRSIAKDDPKMYAQAIIDLYGTGRTKLKGLSIGAGFVLKHFPVPATSEIAPVDWIILASIRDTDNWFFPYERPGTILWGGLDPSAMSMPHSLESWMREAGYTTVLNETNVFANKDFANARKASSLFKDGYKVVLFINSDMLSADSMNSPSMFPNHWVGLTSVMSFEGNMEDPASKASFTVYSWGDGQKSVPKSGSLNIKAFLANYYGYVACKL